MIINRRKIWYLLSLVMLLFSLYGIFGIGLPLGLDFTGGNIAEIETNLNSDQITQKLTEGNIVGTVQASGENQYIIKFSNPTELAESGGIPSQNILTDLFHEDVSVIKFDSIGPTVSQDLQNKAVQALLIAIVGIIAYIAWAFKGASRQTSAWILGVIAVLALVHDAVIVTGLFSVINHFTPLKLTIDTYFLTALLTIIGFSVNDTIVIFDRIREMLRKNANLNVESATQKAASSTMTRSLNTSFTVLIVIMAMLLLGGDSLLSFLFALMLGVIVGTYSSIFIAAPLFVSWSNFQQHRRR